MMKDDSQEATLESGDAFEAAPPSPPSSQDLIKTPTIPWYRISLSLILLFINYFLSQYDKFVLSYFQSTVISSLSLSVSQYSVLSGYATGVAYAFLAIPTAYLADYTSARVWILSIAALWWSLCVVFQGLSHNFWQILLARIGMGIGQAPVEAISVSLISDLVPKEWVFFAESILYVGVYIGEAVSGQIATAFRRTNTPWNTALIAIGIVGLVVAVLIRLLIREPARQVSLQLEEDSFNQDAGASHRSAKHDFLSTASYVIRMRSFWLLTLSSGFRQLAGNVFGYYMPGYLSAVYPSEDDLLSRYGIIVGSVGSFAVLFGGICASYLWRRTIMTPLYMTAIGGMVSSVFVLLMIFSRDVAGGDEAKGVNVLYGVMSAAYLTAETWLGAFNSLLVLLLPPRYKTFGLAIYMTVLVLMYSTGPQIMALALMNLDSNSDDYVLKVRDVLAVLIPLGYWIGGIGFLLCVRLVKRDIEGGMVKKGEVSGKRKVTFISFAIFMGCMVIALFVTSLVFP